MKSPSSTRPFPPALLAGLVGGLALALVWLWWTAAGSAAPQSPHNAPVAVIGPPAAIAPVAAGLERGHAFRVISTATEANALDLVQHRKADAIVNLRTGQLQTVQAASMTTGLVLQQIFTSTQNPVHLQPVEIRPLKSGDPQGLGFLFIPLAAVLAGLPSGVALALLMRKRRPTSLADAGGRILLILVFSGVAALLISLVADGVMGYGGSELLTIWAWATLLVSVAMACAAAFIAAFGIAGVLVAAIPILFFGVPSAPAPTAWNWHSDVFRVLGPFDPFGATSNGLRNGIFFGPATQAQDLAVMAAWLVVPLLLLVALGWREQRNRIVTTLCVDDLGQVSGDRPTAAVTS